VIGKKDASGAGLLRKGATQNYKVDAPVPINKPLKVFDYVFTKNAPKQPFLVQVLN